LIDKIYALGYTKIYILFNEDVRKDTHQYTFSEQILDKKVEEDIYEEI